MILLEGDGHTILLPDGEDLRLQLAVPPPQLLQLPLRLGALHAHHLVDSHAAPLRLSQQTLVLLLQSALIKHTGTSFTPPLPCYLCHFYCSLGSTSEQHVF